MLILKSHDKGSHLSSLPSLLSGDKQRNVSSVRNECYPQPPLCFSVGRTYGKNYLDICGGTTVRSSLVGHLERGKSQQVYRVKVFLSPKGSCVGSLVLSVAALGTEASWEVLSH